MIAHYRYRTLFPMKPYVPGGDLSNVLIKEGDVPEEGGMIGLNGSQQFYVSKFDFLKYYELADDDS